MRIVIIGLGGVGAYIGARLSLLKEEHEIIFLARGEHLKAINEHGLKITEIDKTQTYIPSQCTDHLQSPVDVIFLCTKTYDSKKALDSVKDAITPNTLIIPIANGVNSKQMLQPLTPAKLTQACVYIVSHKIAPGHIKKSTKVFALMLDKNLEPLLGKLFERAGLRVKFHEDITQEIWKKYLFISAMGSLTSYYEEGMGSIYQHHQEELEALLHEIHSVAIAEGIKLEESEISKAVHTSSKLPLDAPTSLWLDLQAKGNNELESLSHYILIKAQKHQLNTPVMQKIYTKLQV